MTMFKRFALLALVLVAPLSAFAQTAVPAALTLPPWVVGAVQTVTLQYPVVGTYLVLALKIIGIASAILTALSIFIKTLSVSLQGVLNFSGLSKAADMIDKIEGIVMPVLQYFSIFNVQKKQ